jgi:hypothetical protein
VAGNIRNVGVLHIQWFQAPLSQFSDEMRTAQRVASLLRAAAANMGTPSAAILRCKSQCVRHVPPLGEAFCFHIRIGARTIAKSTHMTRTVGSQTMASHSRRHKTVEAAAVEQMCGTLHERAIKKRTAMHEMRSERSLDCKKGERMSLAHAPVCI